LSLGQGHTPINRRSPWTFATHRQRNWGTFSIFNVWTSDVHSLWGYFLAASLFLLCGSFPTS
jgi:cytosine/uracil/thiamine/allantoin permease